jgi:hypothetical protein
MSEHTSDHIKDYLISQSVGSETTIFVNGLPASPDAVVGIFDTGGAPPTHAMGDATPYTKNPGFQLRFRGAAYDEDGPHDVAEAAYDALAEVIATTLSSVFYHRIMPLQSPFIFERDENNRVTWIFNVAVEREQ